MNRYCVKSGDSFILAYSEAVYNIGDSVRVNYISRFDGVRAFFGIIKTAITLDIVDFEPGTISIEYFEA